MGRKANVAHNVNSFLVDTRLEIALSLQMITLDEKVSKMVSLFKYIDEISQD